MTAAQVVDAVRALDADQPSPYPLWRDACRSAVAVALMGVAANILARYIERYRWIAWIGLVVIVYVAIKMIYDGYVDPNVGITTLIG